jgi:GDP-L-fucose synthase
MGISKETYQAHTVPMLSHLNIGTGEDCTIRELVDIIAQTTGFRGEIRFDSSKPDGTPRKLLDVSRLRALGWAAEIRLDIGLKQTYDWYLQNHAHARSK